MQHTRAKKPSTKSAKKITTHHQKRALTTKKIAHKKATPLRTQTKRTIVHHLSAPETAADFITTQNDKLTLVKFSAEWCGPCRVLKPKFDELSGRYSNVTFTAVDADDFNSVDINDTWPEVTALPTTLFIKNNKCVDKVVGVDLDGLVKNIEKHSI